MKNPLAFIFSVWLLIWIPIYWSQYGWQNFLWLCDAGNFVIAVGLWRRSRLLISSQAVGLLWIQLVWTLDVLGRLILGFHPLGGTEYMFDSQYPLYLRLFSTFHVWVPCLLIILLRQWGLLGRAWRFQALFGFVVLWLTFFLSAKDQNINWIYGPFGLQQNLIHPAAYVLFCCVAYPFILYWTGQKFLQWAIKPSATTPELPEGQHQTQVDS